MTDESVTASAAGRPCSHYKSDRVRYDVIRHMHDSMLAEAHR